eukprot:350613-Pyramimonas_sp.AAC.1
MMRRSSRKRESARVERIVGSLRPRPTIRDTGSALAAQPPADAATLAPVKPNAGGQECVH